MRGGGHHYVSLTSAQKKRYQLQVDPIRCDGYGYCVELMAEYLGFDDWGFPIVKERDLSSEESLALAKRAEHLCPKLAFKVTESSL